MEPAVHLLQILPLLSRVGVAVDRGQYGAGSAITAESSRAAACFLPDHLSQHQAQGGVERVLSACTLPAAECKAAQQ